MKQKLIITIMAFGMMASPLFAQESGLGAKGGLNFANISGEGKTVARTSIHLGGYYTHMFTDVLAVQAELVYSGQGAKQDTGKLVYKVNYINLPVMAKYYVTEAINLQGGLQFGFLAGATADDGKNSASISNVNGFDLSLGLGAGYELESGLNFGLRYNIGMTNVFNGPGAKSNKNGVLQLTVAYRFTDEALF